MKQKIYILITLFLLSFILIGCGEVYDIPHEEPDTTILDRLDSLENRILELELKVLIIESELDIISSDILKLTTLDGEIQNKLNSMELIFEEFKNDIFDNLLVLSDLYNELETDLLNLMSSHNEMMSSHDEMQYRVGISIHFMETYLMKINSLENTKLSEHMVRTGAIEYYNIKNPTPRDTFDFWKEIINWYFNYDGPGNRR